MIMHPERYPVHGAERGTDPEKGQVYGGLCNTTRCESEGANYWNSCTHGLYCLRCAQGINYRPHGPDLCIDYGKKPETLEEMAAISEKFAIDFGWRKPKKAVVG